MALSGRMPAQYKVCMASLCSLRFRFTASRRVFYKGGIGTPGLPLPWIGTECLLTSEGGGRRCCVGASHLEPRTEKNLSLTVYFFAAGRLDPK